MIFASMKLNDRLIYSTSEIKETTLNVKVYVEGKIDNISYIRDRLFTRYHLETESNTDVVGAMYDMYIRLGYEHPTIAQMIATDLKGDFSFIAYANGMVGFTRGMPLYLLKTSSEIQISGCIGNKYSEIYKLNDDEIVSIKFNGESLLYDVKGLNLKSRAIKFQTSLIN